MNYRHAENDKSPSSGGAEGGTPQPGGEGDTDRYEPEQYGRW